MGTESDEATRKDRIRLVTHLLADLDLYFSIEPLGESPAWFLTFKPDEEQLGGNPIRVALYWNEGFLILVHFMDMKVESNELAIGLLRITWGMPVARVSLTDEANVMVWASIDEGSLRADILQLALGSVLAAILRVFSMVKKP